MQPVGLKSGSSMEIPAVGIVGWYRLGALPGGAGSSVLVSHVSWQGKKGAFYNIKHRTLPVERHRLRAPRKVVASRTRSASSSPR